MEFMGTKEAAKKWFIVERRVQTYCATGKIPGATRIGRQWLIPVDAERPVDGRTKVGKMLNSQTPYHFPILIHSPAYAKQNELTKEETELFTAQRLTLKADFLNAVVISTKLAKSTKTIHVKIGAVATMVWSYLFLGMGKEFCQTLEMLEEEVNQVPNHIEDYRLLLAYFYFETGLNYKPISRIRFSELSHDAIYFYHFTLTISEAMKGEKVTPSSIITHEIICKEFEEEGLLPTLAMEHLCLSSLIKNTNPFDGDAHLKEAIRLCVENDFLAFLADIYYYNHNVLINELKGKNPALFEKIELSAKNIFRNFDETIKYYAKEFVYSKFDVEDREIASMLRRGMTDAQIAKVIGVETKKITDFVSDFCKKHGYATREKLVKALSDELGK